MSTTTYCGYCSRDARDTGDGFHFVHVHNNSKYCEPNYEGSTALRGPDDVVIAECMNGPEGCEGSVEYRMPLSGTNKSFPRCDKHWSERLDTEQGIRERYPEHAPADFDPTYAGERWDDDY